MRLPAALVATVLCLSLRVGAAPVAPPAAPPADVVEAAKAHFAAAQAYYDQKNYADAVKEFTESYRLSHRVDLLYNISLCYEKMGQWDQSIAALEEYLRQRPDAPDQGEIKQRIDDLKSRRTDGRALAPPPVEPEPAAPVAAGPVRRPNWWVPGVALAGGAAAALVSALGTGLAADRLRADLEARCPMNLCPDSERGNVQRGQQLAVATDVLIAIGAAAAVTSVVLLAVLSRPRARAAAWLAPAPGGVGVKF